MAKKKKCKKHEWRTLHTLYKIGVLGFAIIPLETTFYCIHCRKQVIDPAGRGEKYNV